jgi:hypothetical protein
VAFRVASLVALRVASFWALRVASLWALRVASLTALRVEGRAEVSTSGDAGVLATMAFLVVFRLLKRDFFWIDILVLLVSQIFLMASTYIT